MACSHMENSGILELVLFYLLTFFAVHNFIQFYLENEDKSVQNLRSTSGINVTIVLKYLLHRE